jgi:acetolactate synthase I/II/III large subunit
VTERGKELWTYTKQNFAEIAEDIGALGIHVEPAEIGPALQQALKADRPVVIDVVSDIDALGPVAVSE